MQRQGNKRSLKVVEFVRISGLDVLTLDDDDVVEVDGCRFLLKSLCLF